ncbi:hypothetical protein OVA24_06585 [Luteolibacter sp. SL250]|uniref:hypothetical protein n=1 Tax=Luteolibacter sp. SL250 TaxID=2995170 RepID=UPI00226F5E1C|nr:hypothetical protein [Luteolibacter sp. SL250]WAC21048.1 hypothetical protein OVA24_06585 [Luteolibacter sp. SL250]
MASWNEERPVQAGIRDGVLRRVMWGEPEAEIMHMLEVNQVPPELAREMYGEARRERLRKLRAWEWRKVWTGALILAAGVLIFSTGWFVLEGFRVWGLRVVAVPALIFGYGLWRFATGLAGLIMAASFTGPVGDVE